MQSQMLLCSNLRAEVEGLKPDESDDVDAAAADGLEGPSPSASLKCGSGPGQADALFNPRPLYPILQCAGEEPSSSRALHSPILHIKPANQASLHTCEVKAGEGGTSIAFAEVPSSMPPCAIDKPACA